MPPVIYILDPIAAPEEGKPLKWLQCDKSSFSGGLEGLGAFESVNFLVLFKVELATKFLTETLDLLQNIRRVVSRKLQAEALYQGIFVGYFPTNLLDKRLQVLDFACEGRLVVIKGQDVGFDVVCRGEG